MDVMIMSISGLVSLVHVFEGSLDGKVEIEGHITHFVLSWAVFEADDGKK